MADVASPRPLHGQPDGDGSLRRARRSANLRRNITAYCFLAPNLLAFSVFFGWPLVSLVKQSFERGGVLGPAKFVGLSNWSQALRDPLLRESLLTTAKYCLMVVPVVVALAFAVAIMFARSRNAGGALARVLILLPVLAPVVAAAFIWQFVVQPQFGLVSVAGKLLGLGGIDALGNYHLVLPTIAALDIWRLFGFWSLVLLAALLDVPKTLYDAARLDGASPIRRFWHVTLPGTRATAFVVLVLTTIIAMQAFDSIYILTGGGPGTTTQTAVLYMYNSIFVNADPGYGAVLALILVAIIVGLTAAMALVFRGNRRALGLGS